VVTTVFPTFNYGIIDGIASAGLLALLIIWSLVNLKETQSQVRLNRQVEVFIIPFFIMFIYMMINRSL
jgi:uncharacterized membrane protein YGL010W